MKHRHDRLAGDGERHDRRRMVMHTAMTSLRAGKMQPWMTRSA